MNMICKCGSTLNVARCAAVRLVSIKTIIASTSFSVIGVGSLPYTVRTCTGR